jgi:hypothetical protein
MNNVLNSLGIFGVVALSIFPALFVILMGLWLTRNGRRRHYLLRSAKKYSISPIFGQSRQSLLREAQNRPV